MNTIALNHVDRISADGDYISVQSEKGNYEVSIIDVEKLSILTTDQGPFLDDVFLLIKTKELVIVLPSEHTDYGTFLFDAIGKKIALDYKKIIEASTCAINQEFVLYSKVDV
jgi:hypothetical protein